MTTRGPATPNRRNSARRTPAPPTPARRVAASGAVRRDGRSPSARARPSRAATPRPAIRRTSSGTTPGSATSRFAAGAGRLNVTTRAALLALALCMVALTMAYPLRAYLTQKATISDLRAQQSQDQQAAADLQRTVDRYRNPTSVQDEARVRLHYQLPGEKIYYLPPPAPASSAKSKVHTPTVPGKDEQPWYSQLWGSAVETSK